MASQPDAEGMEAMKRLLKVGDVFVVRPKKNRQFIYQTKFNKSGNLKVDENRVTIDYGSSIRWLKKETRPGGWKRETWVTTDTEAKGIEKIQWKVTRTAMEGGGPEGQGSGFYPDGHHVTAHNTANPKQRIDFYQSGCFIPELLPDEINLVALFED